jgi:type I restriction enzyme S subunit
MAEADVRSNMIPCTWTWTELESIAQKINPGFPSGKHNKVKRGIPHIRPMNISPKGHIDLSNLKYVEESDYEKLLKGDILFNNTNSPEMLGKTTYIKQDTNWAYSNHMTRIRLFLQYLEPAWVAFYLHHLFLNGFFKMNCVHHVNQASINSGFLSQKVPIPLAPFREQQRIIAKIEELFSRLDAGVEALQKAKAQLQRYRQSVLKAAVEGRLTAEWRNEHPDAEPASELINRIKKERDRLGVAQCKASIPLDLSELPALPRGWEWICAEQLSDFITKGTTPRSDKLHCGSGEIPFIKVYNLTFDGVLDFNVKPTFISLETHRKDLARSLVLPGDILINIVGPPLGKVSIVPDIYPEWNINQAIARFRPMAGYNRNFLSIALRTDLILGWAKRRSKATAGQFNLTLEICRDLPIPVPPVAEQNEIVFIVERCISGANDFDDVIEASIKHASCLRQSILKHAFEGKLLPQDHNDEPASILLERIRAERANCSPIRGSRTKRNNTNQMRLSND